MVPCLVVVVKGIYIGVLRRFCSKVDFSGSGSGQNESGPKA